ncbi:CrcB-like protein-domain-containing protein [Phyllosticta citricarpa]|uniref:CrcB-like protein-domain-containing protein n=2 Tax=Phyllosticta TaxID=121621 RepID=A0ABR1LYV5_9PEZI
MADGQAARFSRRDSRFNLQSSSFSRDTRSDADASSFHSARASFTTTPHRQSHLSHQDSYSYAVSDSPSDDHRSKHASAGSSTTQPSVRLFSGQASGIHIARSLGTTPTPKMDDSCSLPLSYLDLDESAAPAPVDDEELSALPPVVPRSRDTKSRASRLSRMTSLHATKEGPFDLSANSSMYALNAMPPPPVPRPLPVSALATHLYTISYLIFFSIFGTLARLGLQWLTFYPGAPVVFSELWANVGGSFIMGFLAEDRQLFREEPGNGAPLPRNVKDEPAASAEMAAQHSKVKKTIPLYIGLATGFCGSFTSFSSFIRDVFLALSNDAPAPFNHPYPTGSPRPSYSSTVHRNGGYSFLALIGVILTTIALCTSAYTVGCHFAIFTHPFTPTISLRISRRIIDPLFVPLAFLSWLAAIIMAAVPPDRPGGPAATSSSWASESWRGQALFACVFAPLGCLLRWWLSARLNPCVPSFPLGTYAVNIFGTAVLGMAFDLQHVRIGGGGGVVGGGRVGCQVLEGVMDGFCGCLTTVSTWVAEIRGLRTKQAYLYAGASVLTGLGILIVVMGSVKWSTEFESAVCKTTRWS